MAVLFSVFGRLPRCPKGLGLMIGCPGYSRALAHGCICAEILEVPYYYMRNVIAEVLLVIFFVLLFTAWIMPSPTAW